jgi:hypothetical protein
VHADAGTATTATTPSSTSSPAGPPDDRTLVVRIIGGPHLPVGSAVTLRARGPVFAWPRD